MYKIAPVNFSGAVAGGCADGGWWIETHTDGKIQKLGPYASGSCTYCTFMKSLFKQRPDYIY